jgi:hypothetical protein
VIARLAQRDLQITGTMGYERAEATAGGVALDGVDPSTLESRKATVVFLCGKMLDVVGRLGGFNFQWHGRSAPWQGGWRRALRLAGVAPRYADSTCHRIRIGPGGKLRILPKAKIP